jgi:hypothetical protein
MAADSGRDPGVPFFDVPNRIILLIVGFHIAVVCSWAFELTPDRIKREAHVDLRQSISRETGRKFTAGIVALSALAAGILVFEFLRSNQTTEKQKQAAPTVTVESKSIAVLPVETLSEDKSNTYFTDGVQDEILGQLAKIADLKVISRTSAQRYNSSPDNLPRSRSNSASRTF